MFDQPEKKDVRAELNRVYDAMIKNGYDPVQQLSGFILSEDPIYIPTAGGARKAIRGIDRDDILAELILNYFKD